MITQVATTTSSPSRMTRVGTRLEDLSLATVPYQKVVTKKASSSLLQHPRMIRTSLILAAPSPSLRLSLPSLLHSQGRHQERGKTRVPLQRQFASLLFNSQLLVTRLKAAIFRQHSSRATLTPRLGP